MAFPPLKDPFAGAAGSDEPADRDGKKTAQGDAPRHADAAAAPKPDAAVAPANDRGAGSDQRLPGDDDHRDDRDSGPGKESTVPRQDTAAVGSEVGNDDDDDDLEALSEQDLSELGELAELGELDDLVEHRAHNAPIPPEPGSVAAAAAADIPMLTEVVQVPRYDAEDLPQTLAEVNWGDLGQRVRENVLERLLRRSDALLDSQLQNTLAPVLERAAETVAHELHDALNRMIRDIVARAVTEELTRLHAEIAKRNRSTRPS